MQEAAGAVGELGRRVLRVVRERGRPRRALERVEGEEDGRRRDLARLRGEMREKASEGARGWWEFPTT